MQLDDIRSLHRGETISTIITFCDSLKRCPPLYSFKQRLFPMISEELLSCVKAIIVVTTIKILLIPSYHSTDFEVHRNWLAITHSLPVSKWYYEVAVGVALVMRSTLQNGRWITLPFLLGSSMDYRSLLASSTRRCWTYRYPFSIMQITNLNYASPKTVLFQRLTVQITDFVLIFAVAYYFRLFSDPHPSKRTLTVFFLILFAPGFLIVDHIHFQYNGYLIGLFTLSIVLVYHVLPSSSENTEPSPPRRPRVLHRDEFQAPLLFSSPHLPRLPSPHLLLRFLAPLLLPPLLPTCRHRARQYPCFPFSHQFSFFLCTPSSEATFPPIFASSFPASFPSSGESSILIGPPTFGPFTRESTAFSRHSFPPSADFGGFSATFPCFPPTPPTAGWKSRPFPSSPKCRRF